jgi:PAS domain S-box-containing protein
VDDHELVRRGVRSVLAARSDFDVCGEAVDGQDGVEKAKQLRPDVIVMDISMPKLNGFEATRLISDLLPDTHVLILTQHESPETIKQAFRAGARGYVVKSNMADKLESAVDAVSRGNEFVANAPDPSTYRPDIQGRLAALVESSDDAIISKDLNGIIKSWNATAERIFGYSAEEAVGQPITLIIPVELREEEAQILKRLRNGERIEHYETVRVTKTGKQIELSLTISPIRDSHGNIIGASKIARDITDRSLAIQAQARLAAIVESSHDAIISKDLNGIIDSWNAAAERIFGYSAEEAIGQSITLLIPPELMEEEAEIIRRIRSGELIEHFETARVAKNGKRLNVSLTVSPIKDSRGRVIGASKIARDISESQRTERDLREKQELLRAAFTQTYSFLAILSTDGTVVEANRAALEGTGFTRRDVFGRKAWEIWWQPLPAEQAILRTSIATAAKGLAVREECQYALRDGTIRFADRTLNPVQNERGEVVMIVASALDITDQRQLRSMLEERVRDRTRELELKNLELIKQTEVVRELSARLLQIQDEERRRIARELHDSVGQMVAAVSMNMAQVTREAGTLSREACKALEENTGLLEQLSTEIRTISHLLHPPLLDEVGLQSALQWYIDGFSERSKINVNLELPVDFGRLPRNLEITLFRVVQECLTNIHRHSGSSTAAIRVARLENEVRLEVRDAGKGIPKEAQTNLASGKLSGVGLRGMRERLCQMGGQLDVQSNGTGTLILATLPIEVAPIREATARTSSAV